jgi:hypothetical protein
MSREEIVPVAPSARLPAAGSLRRPHPAGGERHKSAGDRHVSSQALHISAGSRTSGCPRCILRGLVLVLTFR